jgi:transcription antitermination factor NusG
MSDQMGDWWAVQVRTGHERLAAMHLDRHGYEIFLPQYLEYRRWSDRVKKTERALYAGYLFCRLSRTMIGKVFSSPVVIRVVGDSRGPQPIPQSQIDTVRRVVETRLAISRWPFHSVGQRVRVEMGPLHGLEGIVVAVKHKCRLIVSIPLLKQSVAVELDSDCVTVLLPVLTPGSEGSSAARSRSNGVKASQCRAD